MCLSVGDIIEASLTGTGAKHPQTKTVNLPSNISQNRFRTLIQRFGLIFGLRFVTSCNKHLCISAYVHFSIKKKKIKNHVNYMQTRGQGLMIQVIRIFRRYKIICLSLFCFFFHNPMKYHALFLSFKSVPSK